MFAMQQQTRSKGTPSDMTENRNKKGLCDVRRAEGIFVI
jgi:hypothetical protein